MVQNPFEPQGTNPFEAPRAPEQRAAYTPGVLDIGLALGDAWAATWRNIWQWVGIFFLGAVVFVASGVTIVGVFVVWPVLGWGMILFILKSLDGQGDIGDLFAGFSRYGQVLWPMLGVSLLLFLAYLPAWLASNGAAFLARGSPGIAGVFGNVLGLAWTYLVVVRLTLAPYLVVEQGRGAVEALTASWTLTAMQKVNIALLSFIGGLILVAGVLALIVGIFPAMFLMNLAIASAYRQLSGVPPNTWAQAA